MDTGHQANQNSGVTGAPTNPQTNSSSSAPQTQLTADMGNALSAAAAATREMSTVFEETASQGSNTSRQAPEVEELLTQARRLQVIAQAALDLLARMEAEGRI
ncbi:MAG: hypothetical protein Q9202_000582 [Teloschistes flavicans]